MPCSEGCQSALRAFENIPGLGCLIAMCYRCAGNKDKAERAAIKSTVGICFCLCNFPAEAIDECVRKRSNKLGHDRLTSRANWMKKHQQRRIGQICLPGSHQSGTYHMHSKLRSVPMCEGWSRCQEVSIGEQLRAGVRFLDLRVMSYEGDIWLHHNIVVCVRFKEVLLEVQRFLKEQPTEIIAIYIDADGKPVDWNLCDLYIMEILKNRLMYERQKDMSIGDLVDQGKNVMIFGVPHKSYSWLGLDYRWPNKSWPQDLKEDMVATIADVEDRTSSNYFWYKAECTPNAAMVTRSIGGVPGAAACRKADEKLEFVRDMAAATNHLVLEVLCDVTTLPFQILSTDFVQDDILEAIISLNDNAQSLVAPLDVTGATELSGSVFSGSCLLNYSMLSSEAPLHRNSKTFVVKETGL